MAKKILVAILVVGLAACGKSTSSAQPAALTESDFAADPELANDGDQVAVTFLEPVDGTPEAGDTGSPGIDVIPIRNSSERTFTYSLDPSVLGGTIEKAELLAEDGTVLLTLDAGAPSSTVTLRPGRYRMSIHSGWLASDEADADSRTVFLEPEQVVDPVPTESGQARPRFMTGNENRLLTFKVCKGCDLTGARLRFAKLSYAQLGGAILTDAQLQNADLRGASLERANLTRANLTDADLFGANLLGADLFGATQAGAKLGVATWPDGAACREDSVGMCAPVIATPTAEWTIFVYGHGDHNLSFSLVMDIAKMATATLGESVNVLVAADYCAGLVCASPFDRNHQYDPVNKGQLPGLGTQFIRILGAPNQETLKLVGTVSEQDLDDPAALQRWIALTFKAYPAKRYAVIFWDHGGSWDGGFGGDKQDTRDTVPNGIPATKVAETLAAAMKEGAIGTGTKLEFVAFDTCLMAGNEVIWDYRDLAKVYIANAELDFGSGLNYGPTLSWIAANPGASSVELGTQEVKQWGELHLKAGADDILLRAHAAFELSKLGQYQADLKTLVEAMNSSTTLDWSEVGKARARARPQYGGLDDRLMSTYYDVGQFLTGLATIRTDKGVVDKAATALASLQAMTIAKSMGTVRTGAKQYGLHAALNLRPNWDEALDASARKKRPLYLQLPWNTAVPWSKLLDKLAAKDDRTGPIFTASATSARPQAGASLGVKTSSGDTAEVVAYVQWVSKDGSGNTLYGTAGRDSLIDRPQYDQAWNGKIPFLGDAPINLEPLLAGPGGTLSRFAFNLACPDKRGVFVVQMTEWTNGLFPTDYYGLVDLQSNDVTYALEESSSATWSAKFMTSWAGCRVLPRLATMDQDGKVQKYQNDGKGPLIPAWDKAPLKVTFADPQYSEGTIGFAVVLRDIWGNQTGKAVSIP